jgi:predicted nucleic acid-binding protein
MMKIFLDTNIFIEYFENRKQIESVSHIFDAVEEGNMEAVISAGGLYTMTYLLTKGLKRNGVYRPEQTVQLRSILNGVLMLAKVVDVTHSNLIDAINDEAFTDLEDSYQYRCALKNGCDVLVTINLRDYKFADRSSIEILSPEEFVEKYLEQ